MTQHRAGGECGNRESRRRGRAHAPPSLTKRTLSHSPPLAPSNPAPTCPPLLPALVEPPCSTVAGGGVSCGFGHATAPPLPVATRSDLDTATARFEALAPRLSPPPPSVSACPGVFRRGRGRGPACGGRLVPASWRAPPLGGVASVHQFWRCERAPSCSFTDAPPPRVPAPSLDAQWRGGAELVICPAPGAGECVAFCGGVAAVLRAAGVHECVLVEAWPVVEEGDEGGGAVDLSADTPPPPSTVAFPLELADAVIATLTRIRVGRLPLLAPSCVPPPGVLALARAGGTPPRAPDADAAFDAIPTCLRAALLPFQVEGVRFALHRGGRALIADEMGVGKTLQALAVAAAYRPEWPALVICPASLRLVWAEEVERWLGGVVRPGRVAVVDASASAPPPPGDPAAPDLVITSYEMLARLSCAACTKDANRAAIERVAFSVCAGPRSCFAARGWRVLIVDESHALRTTARAPDARSTEAAVAVAARAPRAVFLSGTPSLGRPFDAFRQVAALAPRLLPSTREAFADRYCGRRLVPGWGPRGPGAGVWDVGGLTRAVELRAALRGALMVRRLKAAVAAQLPPKRRQVVLLPRPPAAAWPTARGGGGGKRAAGGDAPTSPPPPPPRPAPPSLSLAQLAAATRGDAGDAAPPASPEPSPPPPSLSPPSPTGGGIDARSDAHRTALAKLPTVIDWLTTLLSSDGGGGGGGSAEGGGATTTTAPPPKILIFAHHRDVMDGLAAALTRAGADFVRINGSVDAGDRAAAVSRFRSDPRVSAALLSVTAAGVGLDFASARSVVFAELPDEPALVVQAEDRAHRRGATSRVNVYFLIARSTCDERRWRSLDAGLARLATLADGESGGEGGLAVDRVRGGGDGAVHTTQAPTQALAEAAAAALHPPPPPSDSSASEDEEGGAMAAACVDEPADVAPPGDARAAALPPHDPWWELSPHTGRLHAHATPAGDALIGLSAPLAALAAGVEDAAAALAAAAAAPGGCAAPRALTDTWASSAADVAADLTEARGVTRAQFAGVVLRAPLSVGGGSGGASGRGTTRHDAPRAPLPDAAPPPPGSSLRTVSVTAPRGAGVHLYAAHVGADGVVACLACGSHPARAPPLLREDATLSSRASLFCSGVCDAAHAHRTSAAAARRAVAAAERGVCCACGLDARALVAALRAVEKGSPRWRERRAAIVAARAPAFSAKAAARLVASATSGAAWQADHVTPVHRGGGACGVANLRTLCTACHAGFTAAQATARAVERRGGGGAAVQRVAPARRQPPPPPPLFLDDEEEEEGGEEPATAMQPPPPKRVRGGGGAAALDDVDDALLSLSPPPPPPPPRRPTSVSLVQAAAMPPPPPSPSQPRCSACARARRGGCGTGAWRG